MSIRKLFFSVANTTDLKRKGSDRLGHLTGLSCIRHLAVTSEQLEKAVVSTGLQGWGSSWAVHRDPSAQDKASPAHRP